jgi:hypothetical protein
MLFSVCSLNFCHEFVVERLNPLKIESESESESESELELLYDWRFTVNQFVLAPSPIETQDP